ncbi:hypothetical protein [Streptomyces poriferorum]|uniref:Uncharacterized protein n=1 Tax=Streptomyces poriferorum TaxID=2798799 RepID=A0ABY9IY92_9ACTN|nr:MULTISPECIES: hypothetical protein [unclassified Streptomyces]MDP5310418.1 hypothetical protein [Streptomyces sp. Alt4]WLQ60428.1 hypothetical protein P8A19_35615 [Streptomyces sp. Alt2]
MQLPEQQPTRPGQLDPVMDQALQIAAAVDEAFMEKPTAVRIEDPDVPSWRDGPRIGTAPPVPQFGRPPMTQRAVDLNTTILTSSVLVAVVGGSATAVLWSSGHANPTVIAWICGGVAAIPAAAAVPILALKGLMKSAKEVVEVAPPTVHNHYNGPVTQDSRSITTSTHGVIANTRNQTPN